MKQNLKRPKLVHGVMLLLMLLFSGFTTFNLQAQSQIKGTVLDAGGNPIPGVSVLQKGTSNGVVTDFDGIYSLKMKGGQQILIFSYLGFETKEVNVAGKTKLNVEMKESAETLDEIVIVGYQAVKRNNILGAVSNVKAASIEEAAPVDALQGIQGKLSGVQIVSNNGPGEGFDIRIRGVATLTEGSTTPLYVVDGQQTFDIDNIDPSDIESLEVLKDGASTAVYGSQGSNGVVLITTKSGKAGKMTVDITNVTGVNTLVGQIPQATSRQRIIQERANNFGSGIRTDTLSLLARNSNDIQSLVSRPSLRTQTNITFRGGTEKARYYWNSGFLSEEGVVIGSGYKRVNTRIRLDLNPTDKLSLGTNVNLSFENRLAIDAGSVLRSAAQRTTYLPLLEPNGEFVPPVPGFASTNPLQSARFFDNVRDTYRTNISVYAQYDINENLSFRSTAAVDYRYINEEIFRPASISTNTATGTNDRTTSHINNYRIQQDNVLNYSKTWDDKHNFKAFLGTQTTKRAQDRLRLRAFLASDQITTFNNAIGGSIIDDVNGNNRRNSSISTANTLFSVFTGFNYNFQEKYLLAATLRRDGSSRFSSANKFGYFPSASVGWKVSKEGFLKKNKYIKNLMFRYSYGVVGNDRVGDFEFQSQVGPGFIYDDLTSFAPVLAGNPALKWEETTSQNLGFDLTLFKGNRLNISFDLYRNVVKDLLTSTQLPRSSGFASIRENTGSIRNQGIDASINGVIYKKKGLTYSAGFNIGILENKVLKLDTPIFASGNRFITREGESIGQIWGHNNLGIYQWDESNAYSIATGERLLPVFSDGGVFQNAYTNLNGTPFTGTSQDIRQLTDQQGNIFQGGDVIWEDLKADGVIDTEDRTVIGSGLPTITGGFTNNLKYKNFTFSTLFDYSFGNDIYRRYDDERDVLRASVLTASPARIENAWRRPGDISVHPTLEARLVNRIAWSGNVANSLYVTSGSYIKWRYMRFGYNFPKDVVDGLGIGMSNLKLDFAINNVLTWTNYEGYNPEFGSRGNPLSPSEDNLRFPNDREFLVTLKVQF